MNIRFNDNAVWIVLILLFFGFGAYEKVVPALEI